MATTSPDSLPADALAPDTLMQVERAVAELRGGLAVVLFDERAPARLILAAETATQARVNAVLAQGQGEMLITPERAETLKIRRYTEGAIAIPLDAANTGAGVSADTHIDAIAALADPARDMKTPLKGPFAASRSAMDESGRAGIQLAKLAGLLPAVVSARLIQQTKSEAKAFASQHDLHALWARDVLNYEQDAARHLTRVADANVPLELAPQARLVIFREGFSGREHVAIIVGQPRLDEPVLVRIHSECFTGDLLDSLRCDCGPQLRGALSAMSDHGAGILLYLAQEGRAIGLPNKMRAYHLQDEGFDTFEANRRVGFEDDERIFDVAAGMLKSLGFEKIRLMTNNPAKLASLSALGIEIVEHVPLRVEAGAHNSAYLDAKKKSGHLL